MESQGLLTVVAGSRIRRAIQSFLRTYRDEFILSCMEVPLKIRAVLELLIQQKVSTTLSHMGVHCVQYLLH